MNNAEKLVAAFAESLGITPESITDDLKYQSIPEWDSVSHMVLIAELEDKFEVSLETDDVIDMSSVGKAKEILKKYGIEC